MSWRVHLLGLLGYSSLQNEFRLDEPYDSPHNSALMTKMPDIYREVDAPSEKSLTRFVAVDGPGSLFEGGKFGSLNDITDPVGETMLILVVPKELAVVWTKPDDFVVNTSAPLDALQPIPQRGLQFLSAEGSVRSLFPATTAEQFRALITYRGGEPEGILDEILTRTIREKSQQK